MTRRKPRHKGRHERAARALNQQRTRQANAARSVVHSRLLRSLDDLNAYDTLSSLVERPPDGLLVYGPKAVTGGTIRDPWAGVVIWSRKAGYHSYQMLTLFGVWAAGDLDAPEISAGTRTLRFQAAYYNPEAYFFHIRRDFATHYGRDAPPPEIQHREFTAVYATSERLALRQQVEAAAAAWRARVKLPR